MYQLVLDEHGPFCSASAGICRQHKVHCQLPMHSAYHPIELADPACWDVLTPNMFAGFRQFSDFVKQRLMQKQADQGLEHVVTSDDIADIMHAFSESH